MFSFRQSGTIGPVATSLFAAIAMLSLSAYAVRDLACSFPPVCDLKLVSPAKAPPAMAFVLA